MQVSSETVQDVLEATVAQMAVEIARKQVLIVHLSEELRSALESSDPPVSGPTGEERIDPGAI